HFLAGLEIGYAFRRHVDRIAGARVAADPRVAQPSRERAETAQFDAAAFGEARRDLVEEYIDHLLNLVGTQVGILGGERLQELGSDHRLFVPVARPDAAAPNHVAVPLNG